MLRIFHDNLPGMSDAEAVSWAVRNLDQTKWELAAEIASEQRRDDVATMLWSRCGGTVRLNTECLKTGFNLKVGGAIYRADLHLVDGNRLFASANRHAMEGDHVADVVCTSYHYDVERWPNYELSPEHCTFTKDFFRAVCKINPDVPVVAFVGIDIC